MDAVAQHQQKHRKQKRTILAWEDPNAVDQNDVEEDDDDVPLGVLYAQKSAQMQEANRPIGLMERRDIEDNEPLSRRRERLTGRPAAPRAATMMNISRPMPNEEEGESLAQRTRRNKDEEVHAGELLPGARPVSGDFTSELMSQFGGDLLNSKDPKGKGKERAISVSPGPEEEETLGQRRKRLQAERDARAKEVNSQGYFPPDPPPRPAPTARRSMADLLQAHPSAGADRVVGYRKPSSGLLGLHEQQSSHRASTMLDFPSTGAAEYLRTHPPNRQTSGGFKAGMYNDGQGGIIPQSQPRQMPQQQYVQQRQSQFAFPQPSLGGFNGFNTFQNPYASNMNLAGYGNGMQQQQHMPMQMSYMPQMGDMHQQMNGMMQNMNMQMLQMGQQPLNQGQIDMVERWRQSVMQ